jgi:chromosome segregation ATPase
MSSLSKIFDRIQTKIAGDEADVAPDAAIAEEAEMGRPASEGWADLGTRVGGDNEALRNLLIDVGRRIDALDDLRDIFGELVVPIGHALNSLEREALDNANLRNALEETSVGYEQLRAEVKDVRKSLTASQSECEHLNYELGVSQQAVGNLEAEKAELTAELEPARGRITDLEGELARETTSVRMLNEHKQALSKHSAAADKRVAELEGLVAAASERHTIGADENRSLQTSVDQLVEENSRLQRRVTDGETAIEKTLTQLSQLQAAVKAAEGERGRLTTAVAEANDKRQIETNTLSTRLEAMSSRAVTAEKLLAEVRQNLLSRTENNNAAERKVVEATLVRNMAEKKLELATTALHSKEKLLNEVEQFRAKLAERANTLLLNVRQRDKALSRAEEEIQALSSRVGQLEAEADLQRSKAGETTAALKAQLESERAGRNVAEGALRKARMNYAGLSSDFDNFAQQGRTGSSRRTPTTTRERPQPRQSRKDLPVVQNDADTAPETFDPLDEQKASIG